MAYFVSTSQHPATLICVKNKAISELQWRTRDLLQLAEQSHSLSKMALWAEQLGKLNVVDDALGSITYQMQI